MTIPQHMIDLVAENPLNGVLELLAYVGNNLSESEGFDDDDDTLLLEAFALISSLRDANLINIDVYEPELDGNWEAAPSTIWQYFRTVQTDLAGQASSRRLENLKQKFAVAVTNGFGYEFTEGDINRVQELINELRDELSKESRLDENHKRRLLKRLEALQKELHKKVSDLDNFYGLLGAFGVAAGKLGTDAKPLVDRVKEIVHIAWKSEARAEQLSSSAENPLLGNDAEPPVLG